MGSFYGFLCVTDPHMELCPHWVFDLLHRIPKVPKWTDIPRFSHIVSFYWPSFGLFTSPPSTVSRTMPKVLIWTLTPKLFSLMDILAIWAFLRFSEVLLGPFYDLGVPFQVISRNMCSFVIIVLFMASCGLNS